MPYLIFVISLLPIYFVQTQGSLVDEVLALKERKLEEKARQIENDIAHLIASVEERKSDAEILNWECIVVESVCSGSYERVVLDDGYVTHENWRSELIPAYLPLFEIDTKYTLDLYNEVTEIRFCVEFPADQEEKEIFKRVLEEDFDYKAFIAESCLSDVEMSFSSIDAFEGSHLNMVSKIKKLEI